MSGSKQANALLIPTRNTQRFCPGLPARALWTRLLFDGGGIAVLIVATLPAMRVISRSPPATCGKPITTPEAAAWAVAAIVVALGVTFLLAPGVHFSLA